MRRSGTVSMLRVLAATGFAPLCASAQGAVPAVQSIDIYGSSVFDSAAARAEFGADILRYVALGMQAMPAGPNSTTPENAADLEAGMHAIDTKIRTAIESRVPLAYFEIHVTLGFGPPLQANVTLDVVEKADEARRMPFRDAPTEQLDDPGGVLALWSEYEKKMFELALAGAPMQVNEGNCPVLHCIAPFDLPELAPYLEPLNDGAREHEDALYAVAANSAEQRATALFVLAHTNDAQRLAPVLGHAIYDPSGGVRNNAMRVLIFLAQRHADVDFPIRDLIVALDFPSSSDRNKAGYTVAALAGQPKYRDAIRADAVPVALRMLRLAQPNNHDPAYQILTQVSGETFGDRDYAAWERWAAGR